MTRYVAFNPKRCINCLSCMTIEECRVLIDSIRYGGPRFGEEKCNSCQMTCVTKCPGKALKIKGE